MASLSNYRWQIRKELPNRSSNNEDIVEKAKRLWVVSEGVRDIYLITEMLSFKNYSYGFVPLVTEFLFEKGTSLIILKSLPKSKYV